MSSVLKGDGGWSRFQQRAHDMRQEKSSNKSKELNKARFDNLEDCSTILVLGKRRTGKTIIMKYIVRGMKPQRIIVLVGSKDNKSEWMANGFVHPLFIHVDNLLDALIKVCKYQDNRVWKYVSKGLSIPDKYKLTCVVDDKGYDHSFMFSPMISEILCNGRHLGLSFIVAVQYFNMLHPSNRDQFDYVSMLFTNNEKNIEKAYKEYVGIITLQSFKNVLNQATIRKGLLWIDNTKSTRDITEVLYKDRVPVAWGKSEEAKMRRKLQYKVLFQPVLPQRLINWAEEHYVPPRDYDEIDDDRNDEKNEQCVEDDDGYDSDEISITGMTDWDTIKTMSDPKNFSSLGPLVDFHHTGKVKKNNIFSEPKVHSNSIYTPDTISPVSVETPITRPTHCFADGRALQGKRPIDHTYYRSFEGGFDRNTGFGKLLSKYVDVKYPSETSEIQHRMVPISDKIKFD